MFPVIQLGPLALQTPGLLILIALWVGLNASEKIAAHKGLTVDMLYNLIFVPLVAGVIVARLSFVASHASVFTNNWLSVLALDPRLLDPWAGSAAAFIAALIIGQRAKLGLWRTLDALTPFSAVMAIGIWLAHLAAGTVFGAVTTLPWGIQLWGATRHPTQVYGLIGALIALALVYRNTHLTDGKPFLYFAAFTAAYVLFIEGLRGDSLLIGNIRTVQLIAWLILASVFYQLDRLTKSQATNKIT